jgi:hypothetical protein
MPVQIQLRNGTAAQWTAANPTLAAGEVGIESDTKKQKFGDGTTAWNSLAYANGPTSGTSILYGNGTGGFSNVTVGTGLSFTTGTLSATGGGGGTPGGSDTQIQFNNATAFGGASNLTTDGSTYFQVGGATPLRFADTDSSNYVAFKAPGTVASNVTWTLPSADGTSNQVLSTNGSGTLSWATASGGGGGPLLESYQTISQNYTITTGSNGLSAGPVAVATGYAVTIPSGQTWTVLA